MSMPTTKAMEAVTAMKSSHTANLPARSKDEGKVDSDECAACTSALCGGSCFNQVVLAKHDGPARHHNLVKTIVFNLPTVQI